MINQDDAPQTKSCHIWITALLSSYENVIVSGLVSKGYSVSAADGVRTSLTSENSPCAVIALTVSKTFGNEQSPEQIIHSDIMAMLSNIQAKYYSIVVSEFSYKCIWSASNFTINPIDKSTTPNISKKLN